MNPCLVTSTCRTRIAEFDGTAIPSSILHRLKGQNNVKSIIPAEFRELLAMIDRSVALYDEALSCRGSLTSRN